MAKIRQKLGRIRRGGNDLRRQRIILGAFDLHADAKALWCPTDCGKECARTAAGS
ncbi:MAG: hypothetical protein PW735_03255 [Acidobacteriaceae bacterium]|nr:hypothetical protein [Acidobacteriaceae bacterium]